MHRLDVYRLSDMVPAVHGIVTDHTNVGDDLAIVATASASAASEVDWLTRAARAYKDSPILSAARLQSSVRELA